MLRTQLMLNNVQSELNRKLCRMCDSVLASLEETTGFASDGIKICGPEGSKPVASCMFVLKAEIGKTDFFLYNSSIQQWLVNLACSVKSYPDCDDLYSANRSYLFNLTSG